MNRSCSVLLALNVLFIPRVLLGAAAEGVSIPYHAINSGGGRSANGSVENISSIAVFGNQSTASNLISKSGFAGQLNEAPMARMDIITARPGRSQKFRKSDLLANDLDAEGSPLQLLDFSSTSANGVTLMPADDWILYDAPPGNLANDSFTYTVSDGIDLSVGTVAIIITAPTGITLNINLRTDGSDVALKVFGIPGRSYQLQATADLAEPVSWSNLGSAQAVPASGVLEFTDTAASSTRYYRAIEP